MASCVPFSAIAAWRHDGEFTGATDNNIIATTIIDISPVIITENDIIGTGRDGLRAEGFAIQGITDGRKGLNGDPLAALIEIEGGKITIITDTAIGTGPRGAFSSSELIEFLGVNAGN